jgi:magnesium-transporting ATPase (P-type)
MSAKINVWSIVRGHLGTMRHHAEDRVSIVDITVFFVCPGFMAVVVYLACIPFTDGLVSALVNASAILLGLLLNLLVLMFDQKSKAADILEKLNTPQAPLEPNEAPDPLKLKRRIDHLTLRSAVITESVANISFSVLLCIASLVSLLAFSMRGSRLPVERLESLAYGFNVFIWATVSLTILMVIKRVFALFTSST